MYQIILVIHIILSLAIIGLVLLQRGKGADMGAGFGAGASQTLFGSGGSGSFLTRTTAWLATAFFISCLALSYVAVHLYQSEPAEYLPVAVETVAPPVSDLPNVLPLTRGETVSPLESAPSAASNPPAAQGNSGK